jgi:predicted enzyme related to lactoylglutathione lyase
MRGSHVHLGVKDLAAALEWLDRIWQVRSTFRNERMATLPFGPLTLILDASEQDSPATIGFDSDDCDADFRAVEARGALVLERPTDRPWGARSAYIQGPGALRFEIEQVTQDTA